MKDKELSMKIIRKVIYDGGKVIVNGDGSILIKPKGMK